jgi:serine protease Do
VQIADVKAASTEIRDNLTSIGYEGDSGVLVRQVMRDSPAFKILQAGDVITHINAKPVDTMSELRNRIAMSKPGEEVKLTVWRDKKTQELSVKLAEQPDDQTILASQRGGVERTPQIGVGISTPTAEELEAAGLAPDAKGALVRSIQPMSPAARVGIQPGDLITRIGDKEITSADDARAALKDIDLSKGVRIDLLNREGQKMVTIRQPR